MAILIDMEKLEEDPSGAVYRFWECPECGSIGTVFLDKATGEVTLLEIEPDAVEREMQCRYARELARMLGKQLKLATGERAYDFPWGDTRLGVVLIEETPEQVRFAFSDLNGQIGAGMLDRASGQVQITEIEPTVYTRRLRRFTEFCFSRVERKLKQHHASGEYPDKTAYMA